ncbi:MAG TPA: transcription antitermination factor NusB [Phycisphaerales bacterium]|nr:transcription antitermination factor NusB [Phycisphaerales bacterium]
MNARSAANERLTKRAKRFPDFDGGSVETAGLDERDAGLASAIDHAAARRWLTLSQVADSRLDRQRWGMLQAEVKAALVSGAAQIMLMDRLPVHAVIDETVEWIKGTQRAGAAGLVNAVLRKVAKLKVGVAERSSEGSRTAGEWGRDEMPLSDGRVVKLAEEVFSDGPVTRLAEQTSHSEELISHWVNGFGLEEARKLASHSLMEPPIVVSGLREEGAKREGIRAHEESGFFVFEGSRGGLEALMREERGAVVQDVTSAMAMIGASRAMRGEGAEGMLQRVRKVSGGKGEVGRDVKLVVDACAGRGTKTRQLAMMFEGAEIVASDVDARKLEELERNRKGWMGGERVSVEMPVELIKLAGRADVLVLDVPCSNTGVLARRDEAKHRWNVARLRQLINIQRQIVADTLAVLKDDGRLVYCTCSVDEMENEKQAEWVCEWHGMHIVGSGKRMPMGLPGEDVCGYCDGGYWAVMERKRGS